MEIRKANKEDAREIVSLLKEYEEHENFLDSSFELSSIKELSATVSKQFKNKDVIYLIADNNFNLVGLLSYSLERRGKNKVGVLQDIIITKDFRKKGIGKKLVDEAIKIMKKEGCLFVRSFVMANNTDAQTFWKNMDFSLKEMHGYMIRRNLK